MKLVIQIPAYNEEAHLAEVIHDIRSNVHVKGIDEFDILVVNDGSDDNTLNVAQQLNVDHIVDLPCHTGLATAFKAGLHRALQEGADIIVNIDADLQYKASEISLVVKYIIVEQADMVIGDRQIANIKDYPKYKYISQALGNFLISSLFKQKVKDSTSGFRAMTAETARILIEKMENKYTYTIESLCMLITQRKKIVYVPITIRPPVRPSRLIKSKVFYVKNYLSTVVKHYKTR